MIARLIESVEIAPAVRHFVFEAPELEKLEFVPGQFVSLNATIGGKHITRAYSLASAPSGSNRFELCLNLVTEGAFSPHLFAMKTGDEVEMRQPLGMFTLRNPPRDSILIATGTGIAPMRSILLQHLTDVAFTLLFGVRHEHGLLYRQEFEEMAQRVPTFKFVPTLTRPDPSWTGRSGRVQEHLREAIGDRRDIDVFICGLKPMVNEVRNILREMGFDRKQIFFEKYD